MTGPRAGWSSQGGSRFVAGWAMLVLFAMVGGCSTSGNATTASRRPQTLLDLRQFLLARQAVHDAAIASSLGDCMKSAGFTYRPPNPGPTLPPASDTKPSTDYGFSRELLLRLAVDATPASDPTAPSTMAASGEQLNAYNIALTGTADGSGSGGCQQRAAAAHGADILPPATQQALDTAFANISSDNRLPGLATKWSACMAKTLPGPSIASPDAVEKYLASRFQALMKSDGLDAGLARSDADIASAPRDAMLRVVGELATEERALAAVDIRCEASSGYADLQQEYLSTALDNIPDSFFATTNS